MRHRDRRISAYFATGRSPGDALSTALPRHLDAVIASYLGFAHELVICDAHGDDRFWAGLLEAASGDVRIRLLRTSRQDEDREHVALALAREACRGAYVFEGAPDTIVRNATEQAFDSLLDQLKPEFPAIALPVIQATPDASTIQQGYPQSKPCLSRNDPTISYGNDGELIDRCSGYPIPSLETLPAHVIAQRDNGTDAATLARSLEEMTREVPVLVRYDVSQGPLIPAIEATPTGTASRRPSPAVAASSQDPVWQV